MVGLASRPPALCFAKCRAAGRLCWFGEPIAVVVVWMGGDVSCFRDQISHIAIKAAREVVRDMDDGALPIGKADFLKLISLCVRFGPFVFNGEEYSQCRGLAMGSPLSAVLASLYMEVLERDHFVKIMGRNTSWFRYVDDVLVVAPKNTNFDNKLRRLNNVERNIQFTVEHETDNKLAFLDTVIWREENKTAFSVHRKSTNKDDIIHYYSGHNEKIKSGVVIGFFLRAYRICSEEFINYEMDYIFNVFTKLCYPEGLLYRLREKALKIAKRSIRNRGDVTENDSREYLSVPNSSHSGELGQLLTRAGISTGTKIGDIFKNQNKVVANGEENSVVYKIPCGNCPVSYYGETCRGIKSGQLSTGMTSRHTEYQSR